MEEFFFWGLIFGALWSAVLYIRGAKNARDNGKNQLIGGFDFFVETKDKRTLCVLAVLSFMLFVFRFNTDDNFYYYLNTDRYPLREYFDIFILVICLISLYGLAANNLIKHLIKWIKGASPQNKKQPVNFTLHFKDNKAAFEYAVKYFNGELEHKVAFVGLVELIEKNKSPQTCYVSLAANDKIVTVFGFSKKPIVNEGDLVLFGLMDFVRFEDLPDVIGAGSILAIIEPSHDPVTRRWKVKHDLTT